MHFTVVLDGHESQGSSADIVFIPGPVALIGDHKLNFCKSGPHLEKTQVAAVLDALGADQLVGPGANGAAIVVHGSGHGTADDLATLRDGLADAGYTVQVISLS